MMTLWLSLTLACSGKYTSTVDTANDSSSNSDSPSGPSDDPSDPGSNPSDTANPSDPTETDLDEDGVTADQDCDDENPWVSENCGRVCTGDFEIEANEDLALVAGCQVIEGSLNIDGISQTNLIALNGLEEVTKDFWLFRIQGLENLHGLEQLTSIGGGFIVSYHETLSTLAGLNGLESIGGTLSITSNPTLTNIESLNSLKLIQGSMLLDNLVVTSLDAFDQLKTVGASIYISECPQITSLIGIANQLSSFGEDETIGTYDPDYGVIESLFYVYNNEQLCESEVANTVTAFQNMGWEGRSVSYNNLESCK